MSDHPTPFVLNRFLSGDLSPAETRAVVRHLVRGCERCLAAMPPADAPGQLPPPEAAAEEVAEAVYELPIRRAFEAVRRHGAAAPKIKEATRKLHQRIVARGWDRVTMWHVPDAAILEAFLQRSHELRHEDPRGMLICAFAAVRVALKMPDCTPEEHADYNARAAVEYANALRVSGQLPEAEAQLDVAEQWHVAGTQDEVLELRLQDVRASLYGAQQHYEAAIGLLDEVIRGRLGFGDKPGAARALIGKGSYTGFAGRLEEAFTHFDAALTMIDGRNEPGLVALARHNYVDFMVDAGRYAEALGILVTHREELLALRGRVSHLKLLGIEGRIRAGLDEFAPAESLLREARAGFLAAGVKPAGALMTLDLAAVVLRQSRARYPEATTLAVEALQVFTQLQVKPQVVVALNVLLHAIQQGLLTATFLQDMADFVRKAEHDRRARYQPRFE